MTQAVTFAPHIINFMEDEARGWVNRCVRALTEQRLEDLEQLVKNSFVYYGPFRSFLYDAPHFNALDMTFRALMLSDHFYRSFYIQQLAHIAIPFKYHTPLCRLYQSIAIESRFGEAVPYEELELVRSAAQAERDYFSSLERFDLVVCCEKVDTMLCEQQKVAEELQKILGSAK